MSPDELLASTDWSRLEHAYEDAGSLPAVLVGLVSGDPDTAGNVLAVLDAAVLHQGTIYSATAPVAVFVAAILGDGRTLITCESALPWDDRVRPLRAALMDWLASVGESAAYDEGRAPGDAMASGDECDEEDQAALAACRAVRPQLYQAVAPFLWDPNDLVRSAALSAAGQLLLDPKLTEQRVAVAQRLLDDARLEKPAYRASIALTLSAWGVAMSDLLADSDPAVRAYAAISPVLDGDPRALAEVRAALRDPAATDTWFAGETPLTGWFQTHLTQALLRRTSTLEDIEEEATTIARASTSYGGQASVSLLLPRVFPQPYPPGTPLSPAQQRFRTALDEARRTP